MRQVTAQTPLDRMGERTNRSQKIRKKSDPRSDPFIEDRDALEPPLERDASSLVLMVGHPGQRFLQALHEPTEALQPLPRPGHPGRIQEVPLDPLVRDRQRPPRLVPGRKQPPPPPHHLFVRPVPRDVGVEPHQHMEVVIQDGESLHRDREAFRKFAEPALDPYIAVARALAERERAADTAGDAVVPTGDGRIDQMRASNRHGGSPRMIHRSYQRRGPGSSLHCMS